MSRWTIFLNKKLWKHVGIIIASAFILLISIFFFLKIYTLHGQSSPVPDFTGLTEAQLQHLVKSRKLRYTIIDSVHIDNAPKGVVIEQDPIAGEYVKKNRNIFFTINAWSIEKVAIPNLTDYSLRNAKVILESFGLALGELIYIPSEYTNLVLGQHLDGKPVQAGTLVAKGTKVSLLIGRGLSNETTAVPNLIGMNLEQAIKTSQSVYLNIGAAIYDDTIITPADSAQAVIWRQNPPSQRGFILNLGASLDVWLTTKDAVQIEENENQESGVNNSDTHQDEFN